MPVVNRILCIFTMLLLFSCGGGDGPGTGPGVSGYVPYLVSEPVVDFSVNINDPTRYDVTVTLQADGPTGVAFVDLWVINLNNAFVFANLELTQVGANTWSATTNPLLPLGPGDYIVDDIQLQDSDVFNDPVTRTGWYVLPMFGGNNYYVDEREIDNQTQELFFYHAGTSPFAVTRFTLP